MVLGPVRSDPSSASPLGWLQALLQLDSGERRTELERIRRDDPAAGAALEELLAHDTVARAEGFLADRPTSWVDELAPGSWIGPYQIIRLLGRGGMGTVYLAERRDPFRKLVAIKRVRAGIPGDLASRFDAERRVLATLDHSGIVRLLDGGDCPDGSPYLVMDYVAGAKLDAHCRGATREQRVRLVLAVAEALTHAHGLGIVHRDLKPSNILVDEQGRPRITDFGLAKLIASAGPGDDTETHQPLGTPAYMAPERLTNGPGRNEPGVDVYSLGVVLFTLLADQFPFGSGGAIDDSLRAVREDPPPLRQVNPTVPRDLETIAARALARDPRERFADAGALAEQLRRYLAGEPLTIHPPSRIDRLARWTVRHRRPLLAWAASFVVVLVLMLGVLVHWNQGLRRDQDALRTTMRSMWLASTRLFETLPRSDPAALSYHGELARSFESIHDRGLIGEDPTLDRQGAVLLRQYAAALAATDKPAEALPYFDRSIAILGPLPDRIGDPSARDWVEFDLFRGLSDRALTLHKLGRTDEALDDSRKALGIIRGLTERSPDDPAWWEARGRQLLHHARFLRRLSRPEDARLADLEALEHARRSVKLSGEATGLVQRKTLVMALHVASDAFSAPDDQERCLLEACELADHLGGSDDESALAEQTAVQDRLGAFLRDHGRPAEAAGRYRRVLELIDARSALSGAGAGPALSEYRQRIAEELEACRRAAGPMPDSSRPEE